MRPIVSLLILVAFLSTACGSSPDVAVGSDPTAEPTTTTAPASTTDASATPPGDTTAASVVSTTTVVRSKNEAPIPRLVEGFNNAGLDILRNQPLTDNAVLSPTSIGHAVLMARAAADEPTGAAIDVALNLPEGIEAHEAWKALDDMIAEANGVATNINSEPTPTVVMADRIWPASGVAPAQDWIDLLATYHRSDVSTIDVSQPEDSRAEINEWVAEATRQLIPELLPPGFIKPQTTLVLTDTIYFDAQWQSMFGKYGTVDADFTKLDGTTESTTFMRDLENYAPRGFGDGFAAATLPYAGEDFSMLVIVPDEGRFDGMRANLSHTMLGEIDAVLEPGAYELLLPKWHDTISIDLLPWLTKIGASPGSYPSITPASFLSDGVHAVDIRVDEIGTIAAAATALGWNESGPPSPEFTIAFDRPFFYVIRHDATGLVMFAGQVTDPGS